MDYTKKIHDIIFVSDKIVTYKVAAAILNVQVNEAKSVLLKYVSDLQKKDETLHVSYVVGGITTNNVHKVIIVSDSKYEKVKSSFDKITIDHIYSIQKSPLVDWACVFNVDDFLYAKKDSEPKVQIKQEIEDTVKESPVIANTSKTTPPVSKKGSISNFFSQSTAKSQNKSTNKPTVKKEPTTSENGSSKPNALSTFMNKNSNKENNSKVINNPIVKKEETKTEPQASDSENDEIVTKPNKKRTRAIIDDEDEIEAPTKCPKVDILDDPMENEISDEDIFGSPEKEELTDTEETAPSDAAEKETQNSEAEVLYEDEEGYFVTEKKVGAKKRAEKKEPEKVETKKEIAEKKKIEKQIKKEVTQKLKKNTNQNTLFTYFQKK